jgi:hypothetical protein
MEPRFFMSNLFPGAVLLPLLLATGAGAAAGAGADFEAAFCIKPNILILLTMMMIIILLYYMCNIIKILKIIEER